VQKQDISFGPRTQDGVKAWETSMTLAAMPRGPDISFCQYIYDRISQANQTPPLASLTEAQAQELAPGASWSIA
jgi:hypothetical protein